MKYLIYFILIIGTLFISCRKDEECNSLDGEKSLLIGEWEWQYTILKYRNPNFGNIYYDTIYKGDELYTQQIQFTECGKINCFENNELTSSSVIFFDHFTSESETEKAFGFLIYLNDNPDLPFYGIARPTIMSTSGKFLPEIANTVNLDHFVSSYKKM